MRIGKKLILSHLAIAVIPAVLLGIVLVGLNSNNLSTLEETAVEKGVDVVVQQAKAKITEQVEGALQANTQLKKSQIEDYSSIMESRLRVASENQYISELLVKCDKAFMAHGDSIDSDEWRARVKVMDPFFAGLIKENHWADVYLMGPEGSIVYTHKKDPALGKSVTKEPLKASGIGQAFRLLAKNSQQEIAVADFASFKLSKGKQTAVMIGRLKMGKGLPLWPRRCEASPVAVPRLPGKPQA